MKHTRTFDIRRIKGDPNVTEAEAAAIAAYTGPVQQIQMGKSAFNVGYIWDGFGLIERIDTEATRKSNTPQARRAAQRREQMRLMMAEGLTPLQMAHAMNVSLGVIQHHTRRIAAEEKQ